MSRTTLTIILVIALLLGGLAFSDYGMQSSEKLTIGVMIPLTGGAAPYGKTIKNGIDLASEESNLSNVRLVYEDTKCKGKESAKAMRKLVSVDNAVAVIGEACSGATLAASPIANRKKVPLISPASTTPKLSDSGNYTFRTIPSDRLAANFAAELVDREGYKRLGILYSNEDYGLGYSKALENNFENLGNEMVSKQSFKRKTTDLRTQITKVKQENPDSVFIISNSPASASAALKQMDELGLDVPVFGSEGLKSSTVVDGAGNSAENMVIVSTSKGTSEFKEKFKQRYGEEPGLFAAQGYDAYMAIARAVENGARTSEEIENQLRKISFNGATGKVSFDENGDVRGGFKVFEVRNSSFAELE